MKIIAIAGQYASGKDELANYLAKRLNEKGGVWHRCAFANAVKKVFCDSFDVKLSFVEEWKRNAEPPPGFLKNIRHSLQFIGDGFRQIRSDIWIDIALRGEFDKVFSDSRYINEARAVKSKGGINIALWRPGYENDDPNPSESQVKEVVENVKKYGHGPLQSIHKDFSLYDYLFINDGNLQDLRRRVDEDLIPFIESYKWEK